VAVVVAGAVGLALTYLPPRPAQLGAVPADAATLTALAGSTLADAHVEDLDGEVLATRNGDGCRLHFRGVAAASRSQDADPGIRTRNFRILAPPGDAEPACVAFRAQVAAAVQERDRMLPAVRPGDAIAPRTTLESWLLALAAALDGVLLLLGWRLVRELSLEFKRLIAWGTCLALALRAVWPHRLTAVGFAYEWFAQAVYLDGMPRYGPGSLALWSKVLGPLVADHRAILWLHAGLGAMAVGVWAAVAASVRGSRRAGGLCVTALACTPLFLREHGSESMHTAVVLGWGVAALALVQDAPRVWTAVAALVWAGAWRLDLAWAGPFVAVWAWAARGGEWRIPRRTALALTVAVGTLLWVGILRAERDAGRGNLPQLGRYLAELPQLLASDALPWRGDWFPAGIWLVLPLAIVQLQRRLLMWCALGLVLAVAVLLPSYLDYNETSLPRLQAPAAWLLVVTLAVALDQALVRVRRPILGLGAAAAAFAVSAAFTLPASLRRTASHADDELLREALAYLPSKRPYSLATRTYADTPSVGLHLHLPTWRFHPPHGTGRVVSADALASSLRLGQPPDGEVYFLRTFRCFAGPVGTPAAGQEHPACNGLAHFPGMKPVFARTVENPGESATFNWYGARSNGTVGLYRLDRAVNRTE
jgi:hypothetical protein